MNNNSANIIDLEAKRNHVNMHYQLSGLGNILSYLLTDITVLRITIDERATPEILINTPPVDSDISIKAIDAGTLKLTKLRDGKHTANIIWHT